MAVFRYKGIQTNGKEVNGVVDAASEREARQQLKGQDIYLTELDEQSLSARGDHSDGKRKRQLQWRQRTSPQERIVFTRQLATLLSAGFSVVDALKAVEDQIKTGYLRQVIIELRSSVSEGQALSATMSRFPDLFPPYYHNLVRAGESSGALETVLSQLAEVMEAQAATRSRLVSAMIYPAIMAITGLLILIFLMSVVVPQVVQVFQDTEQALPFVTRSLLTISDFFAHWGMHMVVLLVLSIWGVRQWARSLTGREKFERMLLRLPLIGTMLRRVITLRVTQTLALLLRSGVDVIKSLQITAEATGFATLERQLSQLSRSVAQGGGALSRNGAYRTFPLTGATPDSGGGANRQAGGDAEAQCEDL